MGKIMYVEDDRMNAKLNLEVLGRAGDVAHADCYSGALKLLDCSLYDLYLLDCEFPREFGREPEFLAGELIWQIRKRHPDAKIVVHSHGDYIVKMKELGARFISKRDIDWMFELAEEIKNEENT